jgi:outer membrane receptor for ferric coprogen and ferric-rhodotorulic acid
MKRTLRGRMVVTVQDKKDFVDVLHGRNHQLYGVIEADLRPDTTTVSAATARRTTTARRRAWSRRPMALS